jgi:hypothetical protein
MTVRGGLKVGRFEGLKVKRDRAMKFKGPERTEVGRLRKGG